jgi:hypothetical protein
MAKISEKTWDCIGLTAGGVAAALLLRPFQNTPFIDDYAFAWPVEELVRNGRLGQAEYCNGVVLVQTLWAALFCLPFGFSFTALRISTYVLALSGVCGIYLTARELGTARRDALLGAAALGVYPVYFMLSVTYMTDVGAVAFLIWAGYAFVRAVRAQSTGWLLAAAALTTLSLGVRVVGVVLPGAMVMVLLLHAGSWGRWRGRLPTALGLLSVRLLIVTTPLLVLWLLYQWKDAHTLVSAPAYEIGGDPQARFEDLKYALDARTNFDQFLGSAGFVTAAVGVAVLPLSLAALRWNVLARSAVICVALALVLGGFTSWSSSAEVAFSLKPSDNESAVNIILPLDYGSTWALNELGGTKSLVPGTHGTTAYEELPGWAQAVCPRPKIVCLVLLAVGWWSFSIYLAHQTGWLTVGLLLPPFLLLLRVMFYPLFVSLFGVKIYSILPTFLADSVTLGLFLLLFLLLCVLLSWARSHSRFLAKELRWPRPEEAFFLWTILGHVALLGVLWLFYDRYALPLVPPVILGLFACRPRGALRSPEEEPALARSAPPGKDAGGAWVGTPGRDAARPAPPELDEGPRPGNVPPARPRLRLGVAAVVLTVFGALTLIGVRDHLAYNAALWQAVAETRALPGAKDSEIDGGYMVTGWLQYAHPENAHRNDKGRIVIPWFNSATLVLRYQVANREFADWSMAGRKPKGVIVPASAVLGAGAVGLMGDPLGPDPLRAASAYACGRSRVVEIPGYRWKVVKSFPYHRWLARSGAIVILVGEDEVREFILLSGVEGLEDEDEDS